MGQDEGKREVTVYSVSPPLSDLELGTCHWLTHLIFTTTLRGQNVCSKFTDDKTMNKEAEHLWVPTVRVRCRRLLIPHSKGQLLSDIPRMFL